MIREETDETKLYKAVKQSYMISVLRACDSDACALPHIMIQNDGPHSARVQGRSVTTWMRLASDMRARPASDRLRPHVYGRGGAATRGGAIFACRRRPPVRSDGPDEGAVGCRVATTSV